MGVSTKLKAAARTPLSGTVPVRYLGSKARLADFVVSNIKSHTIDRPVIDLFAGTGHISAALAPDRQVVAFDASPGAAVLLQWRLCSKELDGRSLISHADLKSSFGSRLQEMRKLYAGPARAEELFLLKPSLKAAKRIEAEFGGTSPGASRCVDQRSLITGYFSNAYFGVEQALQIDALLYALRDLEAQRSLTPDQLIQGLAALICAATHLTNGAGHFAQFFTVTRANADAVAKLRSRSIYVQWEKELRRMMPAGTRSWRAKNVVIRSDCLKEEHTKDTVGSVRFADPPYTASQYSRFYHVLDTMVLYDFPECTHTGRYRQDRFKSSFCRKGTVVGAFRDLIRPTINFGGVLYLTYPTNGLLVEAGVTVSEVAELVGGRASLVAETELMHAAPRKTNSPRLPVGEQLWRICG